MAISSSNKEKGGIFNEINITPLTDIFLVLLIIMMVMAPKFQAVDKSIEVPEINSGVNVEDNNVTVSVTKDAIYYINGKQITTGNLEKELNNLISTSKDKIVIVKADSKTKNSEIMKIIRAAQATGFEKLTVTGEPLSKKQQETLKDKNSKSEK
jgi:biopolymer transport protein ExbD/biopolymer transport protein TolR